VCIGSHRPQSAVSAAAQLGELDGQLRAEIASPPGAESVPRRRAGSPARRGEAARTMRRRGVATPGVPLFGFSGSTTVVVAPFCAPSLGVTLGGVSGSTVPGAATVKLNGPNGVVFPAAIDQDGHVTHLQTYYVACPSGDAD
jgi:hypothetical protein